MENALGEIAVEVTASLQKLLDGFAEGRKLSESFGASVEKKAGGAAKNLEKAANSAGAASERLAAKTRKAAAANDIEATSIAKKVSGDKVLEASMLRMIKSYDRIHIATARYEEDLADINRLQKAGVISAEQTAKYQRAAATAYSRSAAEIRGVGAASRTTLISSSALSTIIGAVSIHQFTAAAGRALEYASALKTVSQEIGITTRDLQVLRYAGSQVGLTNDQVDDGLRKLTKTLGEAATGSEKDIAVLKLVGFSLKEIKSGAVTAGEALPRVADFLAKVHNPAQRAAVLLLLFGEAGQKLDGLLSGGSKAIDNLRDAAQRLGIVLSDEQIQNADKTANKLADVKQVLEANFAKVVAENAASIVGLASALGQLAGKIIEFMNTNPAAALAIIGALAGGRVGGLPGATIGAMGGYMAGEKMRQTRDDGNMDLGFRQKQLAKAREDFKATQGRNYVGGFTSPEALRKMAGDEVRRQVTLSRAAITGARATAAPTGPLDPKLAAELSKINAPKPPKGPKGPNPETARVRGIRNQEAFERDLAKLNDELLAARQDQTNDAALAAELERHRVDNEAHQTETAIKADLSAKKYTTAQAAQLLEKNEQVRLEKQQTITLHERDRIAAEADQLAVSRMDNEKDLLSAQAGLAQSTIERRALGKKVLDLEYQEEELKLRQILASSQSTDLEKKIAEEKLRILGDLKGYAIESLDRQTAGPLQDYFQRQIRSVYQLSDAIQQLRVQQLEALDARTKQFADDFSDSFAQAGRDILALKSPLDVLRNLVNSLAAQFQEEFIIRPLREAVRTKVGGPLAERLVSENIGGQTVHGKAGDLGLNAQQMQIALKMTTPQIEELGRAALAAAAQMRASGGGGGIPGLTGPSSYPTGGTGAGALFDADKSFTGAFSAPLIDPDKLQAIDLGFTDLSSETGRVTAALQAQVPALGQFGGAISQALQMLSAGGGGGAGGLLGSILKIGGMVAGSIGGTNALGGSLGGSGAFAGLSSSITRTGPIGNPFAMPVLQFHGGGDVPGGGTPRMVDSSHMINAPRFHKGLGLKSNEFSAILEDGEKVLPKGFKGGRGMRPIQIGDIHIHGASDERVGRSTGKQVGSRIQGELTKSRRSGY